MRQILHALVIAVIATLTFVSPAPARAQAGDPVAIAQRVNALMASMTPTQKIGQLFLVTFSGSRMPRALKRMIAEQTIGGVLLLDSQKNIVNGPQTVRLINELQAEATQRGARVPLFIAIDEEGGTVSRLPREATWFPAQMALGATGSTDLARAMARSIAAQMKALGMNMNLAPVLDVNDTALNPVIGTRAFGASSELVARLGEAMIDEYKRNGIIAVAKHFPGHGDTSVDSHVDLPIVKRALADVQRLDVQPFARAVAAGADAVMTAHVLFPALDENLPATLSPRILQDELRGALRFDGLIVSDALSMRALTKAHSLNEITMLAFKAGVDVLSINADPRTAQQALLDAITANPILQRRLDESVRRILTVKARYGLLDWIPVTFNRQSLIKPEHISAARQIAQASVTVVRDRDRQLPIAQGKKVLLVLPLSAGDLSLPLRKCIKGVTWMRTRLQPTQPEADALARRAQRFDVVILATLNVNKNPSQARLVSALRDRPLILVAMQSPYDTLAFPDAPTVLTAYSDVPYSLDALADVLCGKSAAVGVLPIPL